MIVDTRDAMLGGQKRCWSGDMRCEDTAEMGNNNAMDFVTMKKGRRGGQKRKQRHTPHGVSKGVSVSAQVEQTTVPGLNPSDTVAMVDACDGTNISMDVDRTRILRLYFTCPLCQKTLKDAHVLTGCMHRFCRVCIESWCGQDQSISCPTCGTGYIVNDQVPRCLRRDTVFEDLLHEVLQPKENKDGAGALHSYSNHNDMTADVFYTKGMEYMEKKNIPWRSSLSNVMRRYTRGAVLRKRQKTMASLRPPSVILMLSFDRHVQKEWRYVACSLEKTVRQLKAVIAKHINTDTVMDEGLVESIRLHPVLDARVYSQSRKKNILNVLCRKGGAGMEDTLTFGDVLNVTNLSAHQLHLADHPSTLPGSNGTYSNADITSQEVQTDTLRKSSGLMNGLDMTRQDEVSNRWPLFLRHVSLCSLPPGKCPYGDTCDLLKTLGCHIRYCSNEACTYPRCHPWKHLVQSHGATCNNKSCLVCTLKVIRDRDMPLCGYPRDVPVLRTTGVCSPGIENNVDAAPLFKQLGGVLKLHVSIS